MLFTELEKVAKEHGRPLPEECVLRTLTSSDGTGNETLEERLSTVLCKLSEHITVFLEDINTRWTEAMILAFADATRTEPLWRHHFGLHRRVTSKEPFLTDSTPDCVLELARRVIINEHCSRNRDLLRSALRIAANCSADNNTNRSLLLYRNAVEALKRLALEERELDLLLPTLFNICTDYDEVAMDQNQQPMKVKETFVTIGAMALGANLEYSPRAVTSIELFSKLPHQHEQYIANLLELATQPARFGLKYMHQDAIEHMHDMILVYTTFFDRCSELRISGGEDEEEFEDRKTAIYGAYLNLLSHEDSQNLMAQSPENVFKFLRFFSDMLYWERENPTEGSLLQLFYFISQRPEFQESFDIKTDAFKRLVTQVNTLALPDNEQSASEHIHAYIALVNNALTSIERVDAALIQYPELLASAIALLGHTTRLLHARVVLDLLTRLAIVEDGQYKLLQNGIIGTVHNLLLESIAIQEAGPDSAGPYEESDVQKMLPIQRIVPVLARYLVKSRRFRDLPGLGALHDTILDLYNATIDEETKIETGTYCIEIVQCWKQSGNTGLNITEGLFADAILHQAAAPQVQNITGIVGLVLWLAAVGPIAGVGADARDGLFVAVKSTLLPLFRALVPAPPASGARDTAVAENKKRLLVELVRVYRGGAGEEEQAVLRELEDLGRVLGVA